MWDHWLLDSLFAWTRRPEASYRLPLEEMNGASNGASTDASEQADGVPPPTSSVNSRLASGPVSTRGESPRKRLRQGETNGYPGKTATAGS